ncbi:MAG: uroporphyrinogen decarboxylase family protein [Candidatus Sumerlaeia bacterium]|nr:uroporphyrinogen decarboxylase family protein [Candidatus Sumerlaeia bacterium]
MTNRTMSFRERVIAVFRGEIPDYVPWFADLSWWHGAHQYQGTLPSEWSGIEGLVALHKQLNCGIYLQPIEPWSFKFECSRHEERQGNLTITTYKTPKGELQQVVQFIPEQFTYITKQYLLKSASDISAFEFLLQSQVFQPAQQLLEERERIYGEQGIVVVCLPRNPLSRLLVEFAGAETTLLLALEEPEKFSSLLKLIEATTEPAFKLAVTAPASFAMFPDNLSSNLVSPHLFRTYSLEHYRHYSQLLRRAGKYTLVHIDGLLRGLLPLVAESGVDCAEAITPKPMGDVAMEELRTLAGEDLILWGGIPGAMLISHFPESQLRLHVIKYLKLMKGNPRFVLGIGDQLPPNGDINRIRLISELVAEAGKY